MANPEKGLKQPASSPGAEEPSRRAELYVVKLEVDGKPPADDDGELTTGNRLIPAGKPANGLIARLRAWRAHYPPCGMLAAP